MNMLSETSSYHSESIILDNDSGWLDGVWAYFLNDHDGIEDDEESNHGTLSDNGSDSLRDEASEVKAYEEYQSYVDKFAESKTQDLYEKFKDEVSSLGADVSDTSTNVTERAKRIEQHELDLVEERQKLYELELVEERQKQYELHLAEERQKQYELDLAEERQRQWDYERERQRSGEQMDNSLLAASVKRSTMLLAYATKLHAAKKKLAQDKAMMSNRDEARDYNIQGYSDTHSVRVESPKNTYVGNNDNFMGISFGNSEARKSRTMSQTTMQKGMQANYRTGSSPYVRKEGNYSDVEEMKAVKRRELIRRM